jgi:hypothetical protein
VRVRHRAALTRIIMPRLHHAIRAAFRKELKLSNTRWFALSVVFGTDAVDKKVRTVQRHPANSG